MLIISIIFAVLTVALAVGALVAARIATRPGPPVMWQFGAFTNYRAGISGHEYWSDEPAIVPFQDYKFWIRLRPNPGYNLPVLGYWSQARGFQKRR